MTPLRLLLVSPKPPPNGGIGRWTVLLLDWLRDRAEVQVRLVDISPRWRAVDDRGLLKRLIGGGLQGVRDFWWVLAQLVRFRPDVLHLTTSGSLAGLRDITVLGLARCFRCRAVYHIRMGRLPQLAGTAGREWRLLYWAMRLADRVVVIEQPSEMALKSVLPAEKLLRLPNAIHLRGLADMTTLQDNGTTGRQDPETEGRRQTTALCPLKRVLFLGWVIPTKGMRELMEAWRELRSPGWELVVAGPGNEAYRQELAAVAGQDGSLRFLGEVSPAGAWGQMLEADVFVLPTYTEGFPNVVLEAMAAGKPIVATRVGAIPEMLNEDAPEPCGLVIEPRNAPALVDALRSVMQDKNLRVDLGRRARVKVERCYDTDIVFPRLVTLWRSLADGNPHN